MHARRGDDGDAPLLEGAIRRDITAREAADTMYALVAGEQLHLRLVHHCGWSDRRSARFVERALVGALSPQGAPSPRR